MLFIHDGNLIEYHAGPRLTKSGNLDGYTAGIRNNTTDMRAYRWTNGARTSLGEVAHGLGSTTDKWIWLRAQMHGTTLRHRMWLDGNAEPETWGQSFTDANHASGGQGLHIYHYSALPAGAYIDIAWFSVGINGSAAPSPGGTTIEAFASDGLAVSSLLTPRALLSAASSDGVGVSSALQNRADFLVSLGDGLSVSDLGSSRADLRALGVDGIGLSTGQLPHLSLLADIIEGIHASSGLTVRMDAGAFASDSAGFSDSTFLKPFIEALAQDGINLSDTTVNTLYALASASDGVLVSSSEHPQATFFASAEDAVHFQELASKILGMHVLLSEDVRFSEVSIGLNLTNLPRGRVAISFHIKDATLTFVVKAPEVGAHSIAPALALIVKTPQVGVATKDPEITFRRE
jgi:hypothetical protein